MIASITRMVGFLQRRACPHLRMLKWLGLDITVLVSIFSSVASSQGGAFTVGELRCTSDEMSSVGSDELRNMWCDFTTSNGDKKASYRATIRRKNDLTLATDVPTIVWGIYARRSSIAGLDLIGKYDRVAPASSMVTILTPKGLQNTTKSGIFLQPRSYVIHGDLVNLANNVLTVELEQKD
jgi:hypothetical protein